jgi:hypothetical protein
MNGSDAKVRPAFRRLRRVNLNLLQQQLQQQPDMVGVAGVDQAGQHCLQDFARQLCRRLPGFNLLFSVLAGY